ncbi:zinc-binding dehydrogenase [Flavihumibacter sp. UBA7668]|uniref:zinc-binding dehydrogenase n=1 Tax=Flavihumibacter sp. UBA7668 TaxID=1946542 RepID=UPI0025C15948|nr:zinc-binding dehydrogenase [Flavihumibacter sp. UBA7668]
MNQPTTGLLGQLAIFHGTGQELELARHAVPPLQPAELLIRNLYTTLCGSDLHTYCGLRQETCPTVLGHEIVGVIQAIDPAHPALDLNGDNLTVGDIITWSIFSSNPDSPNSIAGIPQKGNELFKYGHALVQDGDAFHGGLAEYCILKANTGILRIPEGMPLPVAATINCSVATVAGALRMAGNIKGKSVLITGMGHLGITCAAMCRKAGAEWIGAVDISIERLEDSLHFGVDKLYNSRGDYSLLVQEIKTDLPRKAVDLVFDMSGSPEAMELGLETLAIGGMAVWVGAVFKSRCLPVNPEKIIRNLLTIKGLHNYNYDDFRNALSFLKENWYRYPFEKAVAKEFSLQEVEQAFQFAVKNKPLRVGIRL